MANETFYLRFENDPEPINLPSDEFFGYDKAKFNIKQDEKRFGRDVTTNVSGGEYSDRREHYIEKMLHSLDRDGFESKIIQGVQSGDLNIELQIEAQTCATNEVDYVTTEQFIQDTKELLIKRRYDTTVTLQNPLTLDNEEITPPTIHKFLMKAFPLVQVSEWTAPEGAVMFSSQGFYGAPAFFNVIKQNTKFEIENSLSWLIDFTAPQINTTNYGINPPNDFKIIEAQNNLEDVVATLDLDILVEYLGSEISDAPVQIQGFFVKGEGELFDNIGDPSKRFEFFNSGVLGPQPGSVPDVTEYAFQGQVSVNIGNVNRGEFVWFYFRHGSSSYTVNVKTTFNSAKLTMKAASITYNTVVYGYRLYDVMKYVVKSISGLEIDAPRFGIGGEFYDLFLSNGNFFRGKTDEPYYISLQDIMNSIMPQFKADYEITPDATVFFGLFPDFYRPVEIARFTSTQFQSLKKTFNPRFCVSEFKIGFKNFESQRETTQANTIDEVHGNSEWLFSANKGVENVNENSIDWTMSAAQLERNRRAAIEEAQSTATNNDTTIFAIDVNTAAVSGIQSLIFTETDNLQHKYLPDTNQLSLKNDNSFSWIQLGIEVGGLFTIPNTPPQLNYGSFTVVEVSDNALLLDVNSGDVDAGNDDIRSTRFTYRVSATSIVGVSWSDQTLSVSGLANPEAYPNLRYSIQQSIRNYHQQYLATMNLYHPNAFLDNTKYLNNPNGIINGLREGGEVREGFQNGIPLSEPILTPCMYEEITIVDPDKISLADWIQLSRDMRTIRGYITFENNDGHLKKVFGKSATFDKSVDALIIEQGEEKYEPVTINIVKLADGNVRVNNEWEVTKLKWQAVGLKYRIMDRENKLLYNPMFWERISVNGNIPESQNQLETWLSSL